MFIRSTRSSSNMFTKAAYSTADRMWSPMAVTLKDAIRHGTPSKEHSQVGL